MSTAALNFVYPPACLFCDREVDASAPEFCGDCRLKLKSIFENECPRCGAPAGQYSNLADGCGQCRRESFAFDRLVRLGVYESEMRLACLRAKASGGSGIARGLADALVAQKQIAFNELKLDLVVPVPEHWSRRILHLHYAAETISRQLSRRLKIDWNRAILRKKYRTPKQATSPTLQRRIQQQGSFAITGSNRLIGKRVLLVDDILTTGSTANAAAKTLKQAGAVEVVVAVIAVSPLRH